MKPKDAFDNIIARAQKLIELHDGLINVRKYRIRQDWKQSFSHLMHWPQKADIDRVDSRDAVIVLRHGATLGRNDFSADALEDLLRSSLTLGVSALDRYVHERVVKGIISALKAGELNRRQDDFTIPAVVALQALDSLRRALKAGGDARPANELRKRIQENLHLRPFQSWRQVEEAFELIGIAGMAGTLQAAYGIANIKPVKDQLNGIVHRRHLIVHEGDLVRHQRGGQVRRNDLAPKYVRDSLDFLATFVGHLDQVG